MARTFHGILQRGSSSDISTDPESLARGTDAYCAFLRQPNISDVLFSDAEQIAAVLQPLQFQLATTESCSTHMLTTALETWVEVGSHHASDLSSESLSALIQGLTTRLPTALVKYDGMETTSAAAAGLATLCQSCAITMDTTQAQKCFTSAAQSLHSLAMSSPPADEWHTKVLSHLLTALSSLVTRPSLHIRDSSAILLDAFTLLWTFGVPTAAPRKATASKTSAAPASAPGSPASSKYLPPWRRSSRCSSSDAADSSPYSSDTSVSSRRDGDAGARVRLASLHLLTLCLRQFPTSLHPVWDRLLPHSNATLPSVRPRPLLGVLLHDSTAAVRCAAAAALQAMLSGPRNAAFVRVARSASTGPQRRARARPARAYMPLSESLALMVQAVHTALAAVLQREASQEVVLEALKAADLLMQHAPYPNLPPELAQELVNACVSSWNGPDSRIDAQVRLLSQHRACARSIVCAAAESVPHGWQVCVACRGLILAPCRVRGARARMVCRSGVRFCRCLRPRRAPLRP